MVFLYIILYIIVGFWFASNAIHSNDIDELPEFIFTIAFWPVYVVLVKIPYWYDQYKLFINSSDKK